MRIERLIKITIGSNVKHKVWLGKIVYIYYMPNSGKGIHGLPLILLRRYVLCCLKILVWKGKGSKNNYFSGDHYLCQPLQSNNSHLHLWKKLISTPPPRLKDAYLYQKDLEIWNDKIFNKGNDKQNISKYLASFK